jgi:hypothetical protein
MFQGRAAARAHLYHIGELDLVRQIGQDAVQWVISEAFRPVRAGEVSS